MEYFKDRLQRVALMKKIDQIDIAESMKVNSATINRWWLGKVEPRPKSIRKLAEFFGCSLEWLANGVGEPFPKPKNETTELPLEFERRKSDKILNKKLARLERVIFKTQCPGYFDDLFDFVAEMYGEDKEGVEDFLEEINKKVPKFKKWQEDKKRASEENTIEDRKYA